MTPVHAEALRILVEELLCAPPAGLQNWPWRAIDKPRALLVYETPAMFAYYLGVDGAVYEYDMDRFMPAFMAITNAELVREVYAKAGERYPELAGIAP